MAKTRKTATTKDMNLIDHLWPEGWSPDWIDKFSNPIRDLEKAGALIVAEIDRLERLNDKVESDHYENMYRDSLDDMSK